MTVGGMGFIPERLLMMMMIIKEQVHKNNKYTDKYVTNTVHKS